MAGKKTYTPQPGDICWVSLDPTKGHEQAGHRPVLVLSEGEVNALTGYATVCPITSSEPRYGFMVPFVTKNIRGTILCDQLRTLDYTKRVFKKVDSLPKDSLSHIRTIVGVLLGYAG